MTVNASQKTIVIVYANVNIAELEVNYVTFKITKMTCEVFCELGTSCKSQTLWMRSK